MKSLLQHIYNGLVPLAFTKAKFEDKPIFLSIGYSTCHWWHVRKMHL
nr:DUF255 domain-containing protein [Oxobacter pfennigii]